MVEVEEQEGRRLGRDKKRKERDWEGGLGEEGTNRQTDSEREEVNIISKNVFSFTLEAHV